MSTPIAKARKQNWYQPALAVALAGVLITQAPAGDASRSPLDTLRERSPEQRWTKVREEDAVQKLSRQTVISSETQAFTNVGSSGSGTAPERLPVDRIQEGKSAAPDMPASIIDAAPTANSKAVVAFPESNTPPQAATTPPAYPFLDQPEVLVQGDHQWILPAPSAEQIVAAVSQNSQAPVPNAVQSGPTPIEVNANTSNGVNAPAQVETQATSPSAANLPPVPPLQKESERAIIADERLAPALPNLGIRRIYQIVPFGDPVADEDIRRYALEQQNKVGLHIDNSPAPPRNYPDLLALWEPPNLYHQPLYFEDVALERYGHHYPPGIQSAVSLGKFGVQLIGFPYQAVIHPPASKQYALGYYRPGEVAPRLTYQIPWNAHAAAVQAGAVVGFIYMIP
ncbi:hypothetical protein Plim_3507 [Planctopirus limnophila DSM 3776]|uniref:Uncharacterized protein n=1 Tax=Planctopirus limnophila (strain ATCC 43296 / DSM 3776 / IFAM 1008 / Mu 290) TaxID=521674 RepID=D5SV34_PLAL2|nr:hypothetical protein Plim_3507 [Planctopirus limnophila DSM 3776]